MKESIQKTNLWYILAYILVPLALCSVGFALCATVFSKGGIGAVICALVIPIFAVIWWIFGGAFIFKSQTKKLEKAFVAAGYKRNNTFYGRGKTVVLDINQGMLGIATFWNPFEIFIVPASRVEKAWTDDGAMGSGIMRGSSMVKFCFNIDGIKIAVPTFQSNQRFRMDDKRILTGISKADMMVQSIEEAKANSQKKSGKNTATKSDAKTEQKSEKSAKKATK